MFALCTFLDLHDMLVNQINTQNFLGMVVNYSKRFVEYVIEYVKRITNSLPQKVKQSDQTCQDLGGSMRTEVESFPRPLR